MKTYPTIDREVRNEPVYAFDKLDGNNIRAEWTRKKGFWKFGSRKRLLDQTDALLGEAQQLVLDKYGDDLSRVFREQRWQKAVAFFELHGPRSFIGQHHPDDQKTVTLFDVAADKKGLLEPRTFLRTFKNVETPALLYQGNANALFAEEVRSGMLEGMTFEGVVCKGRVITPGRPLMFKIKNRAWIDKVRAHCQGDDILFQKLV